MARQAFNRLIATFLIVATLTIGWPASAFAGSLTSASFTASTPYVYTSAQNTRYDYGFTTATTSTLSKVTASVPGGTDGANRYLALNGTTGNYASTPDTPANSITGDLDLRVKASLANWQPGAEQRLLSKWVFSGSNQSYVLKVTSGGLLSFVWTANGSAEQSSASSTTIPFANGTGGWLRATLQVNNAGNSRVDYYTSPDSSSWTALGSASIGTPTSLYDSTSPIEIGSSDNGTYANVKGSIMYAEVRSGVNGAVVNKFDPANASATQAAAGSWPSQSPQAETWSISRSGTNLPADIQSDLSVSNISGLPTGGTANYRFISGVATYRFTPTSVPSGTPITMNLGGFTNTATPGSYTSTIQTWDNSPTPVVVDSATTSALTFAAASNSLSITTEVQPSLTFTVSRWEDTYGLCAGVAQSSGSSTSGSAVDLGRINAANGVSAQLLGLSTNSGGWNVDIRSIGPLSSSSHAFADVPGSNTTPAGFPPPGIEAFGYAIPDARFVSGGQKWAAITTGNQSIWSANAPAANAGRCISYRAQVSPTTPAGAYNTTVIYTATSRY